ncbi:MAG: hypothetical protein ACRDRK_07640 [Pseudonocardia sp.]
MINFFRRWLRALHRRGRHGSNARGSVDLRGSLRSGRALGEAPEAPSVVMDAEVALLREVCVLMLVHGEPNPELAGWCLRVLAQPGAAESAVTAVTWAVCSSRTSWSARG